MQYVSTNLFEDDGSDIFPDVLTIEQEREAAGAARLSTFLSTHESGLWRNGIRKRLQAAAMRTGMVAQARALWAEVKGQTGLARLSLYAGGQTVRRQIEDKVALLEGAPDADA